MKIRFFSVFLVLLAAFGAAQAQSGSICGDPSQKQCTGQYDDFKPQDLIFNTGRAELGTGTRHESDEFYAVVLESVSVNKLGGTDCNFVNETKRRAAQKFFPKNKVFASRHDCSDNIILYSNTKDGFNFMAVYAGKSEADAAAILSKAKKKHPSANIRRMKVILDFSDE